MLPRYQSAASGREGEREGERRRWACMTASTYPRCCVCSTVCRCNTATHLNIDTPQFFSWKTRKTSSNGDEKSRSSAASGGDGGDGGGRSRTCPRCICEEETRIKNSFHLTKMFQCIPAGYCQNFNFAHDDVRKLRAVARPCSFFDAAT